MIQRYNDYQWFVDSGRQGLFIVTSLKNKAAAVKESTEFVWRSP